MQQVSFIHTADIHLDTPFSSLGDKEKADIRRRELESCLENIIDRARVQNIDLLIISGDFFEESCVRGSTIIGARNLFSELYGTEVVIIPGNHDPLKENSYYNTLSWSENVHILTDSKQVLFLKKYNTCIYNMGAFGRVAEDYSRIKEKSISANTFNILVFHGTVDMPFEESNYNAIESKDIFSLGMDYVALGHMHNYIRYQNRTSIMINPGSPEPVGFDEEGIHGFVQGKIMFTDDNNKFVEVTFVPCSGRNYYNIELDVTGCKSNEEIIQKLSMEDDIQFSNKDLYSLTLKGFIPKNFTPDIKCLMEFVKNKCFYVRIKIETSIQFDYEQYLEDPGIKGEFVRMLMDMQENEDSQDRKEILHMAIQLGLQAMEYNRVD
ncbi:metallophosphoesterase family protein [Ruminiclostridium papyrosolvens]|uniref:Metallophosphoesterase n=1 Tax=Ruminiclostridium papyrosolvens C7 TaxID=1330534 RepID=U4R7C8_9FIRM|nr:DNA repair exonuclease [Ruminiclostridium papyrosolvens]EPR14413.1 metallophosphoesterase [Ruminiclostridium papyrosolvens C7]